jgi:hypothetical protein
MQAIGLNGTRRLLGVSTFVFALAACSAGASPAPAGTAGPGGTAPPAGATAPVTASAGASAAGTAAAAGDGCRYATVAEVGAAYGFTVATAKATPPADDNYVYCEYASADGRTVILTYVSRTQAALAIYDGYRQSKDEAVSGVGDEAFWADDVLYVKKGGVFAGIQARSGSRGTVDVHDAGVALGKVIAGRL